MVWWSGLISAGTTQKPKEGFLDTVIKIWLPPPKKKLWNALNIWNTISFSISTPMEGHPMILHDPKINRPFSRGSTFTSFVDLLITFIAFFKYPVFCLYSRFSLSLVWLQDLCKSKENVVSQNNLTIIRQYLLSYMFRPSSGSKVLGRIIHVSHRLKF